MEMSKDKVFFSKLPQTEKSKQKGKEKKAGIMSMQEAEEKMKKHEGGKAKIKENRSELERMMADEINPMMKEVEAEEKMKKLDGGKVEVKENRSELERMMDDEINPMMKEVEAEEKMKKHEGGKAKIKENRSELERMMADEINPIMKEVEAEEAKKKQDAIDELPDLTEFAVVDNRKELEGTLKSGGSVIKERPTPAMAEAKVIIDPSLTTETGESTIKDRAGITGNEKVVVDPSLMQETDKVIVDKSAYQPTPQKAKKKKKRGFFSRLFGR